MPRDATRCSGRQRGAPFCSRMPHCVAVYAACLRVGLEGSGVSLRLLQLLSATPDACAGSGGVCARVCEMRIVAGWLLLMWASVLCVRRCAGVRCARAVRVCVLESRVSLRVLRARRRVLCAVLCCAPVCAALRRRLGWQGCAVGCGALRVVARLPDGVRRPRSPPDRVVGGPGREHAVGAACEAAARLARMFPCGEGRAYVFTLRARAGAGGGVVSPRSDVGWSSAWRGRARREALPPSRCREGKRISCEPPGS